MDENTNFTLILEVGEDLLEYDRDFIEEQVVRITEQRDAMIATKTQELAECAILIAIMDAQGVQSKKQYDLYQQYLRELEG